MCENNNFVLCRHHSRSCDFITYHVCCQNSKPLILQFTALIYYAIHTWSQGNYIARPLHCALGFYPKTDLCALLPEKPIQPFQKIKYHHIAALHYHILFHTKIKIFFYCRSVWSKNHRLQWVRLCSRTHHQCTGIRYI